jgi:hypothetical protein
MKFQIGHIYAIDYDDHYDNSKSYRSSENGQPMVLRERGMLVMETKKMVVLEHGLHVSDKGDQRSDRTGILKLAIVKVQHFGAEK